MQTVTFTCRHCNNLMGVTADLLGQAVHCPTCGQVVVAPSAAPAPAVAAPAAARGSADRTLAPARAPGRRRRTRPLPPAGGIRRSKTGPKPSAGHSRSIRRRDDGRCHFLFLEVSIV